MKAITLLVCTIFVLIGCASNSNVKTKQSNNASSAIGSWSGPVVERGRQYYDLKLTIEKLELGEYAGKSTYSGGLDCGGLITLKEKKAGMYIFDEVINTGSGCVNGRVEVFQTDDGKLRWEWFRGGRSGKPEAHATLAP